MIVLDTNVLSALMRVNPDPTVVDWLDNQPRNSIWITSVTALEVDFGIQVLPSGKRRTALRSSFESLLELIEHRIASFDSAAAQEAASLMARRQLAGRPVEFRDTMIAGIALAHRATLATRNVVHFKDAGLVLANPWSQ
jgi:predicted nucleic acid-binding protein